MNELTPQEPLINASQTLYYISYLGPYQGFAK